MRRILFILFFLIFLSNLTFAQKMATPVNISKSEHASKWGQVAFGPEGIVHVIWEEDYNNAPGSDIFYVSYDGKAWKGPLNLKNSPTISAERPYIYCSPKGNIFVVWDQENECYLREYDPVSKTWLPAFKVSSGDYGGFEPCVTADAENNVYVFWYHDQAGRAYTRARIKGVWEGIKRMNSAARATQGAIAAAKNGWIWCIWREKQPDGEYKIYYSKRRKDTAWTPGKVMNPGGASASHPHMAIGQDNIPCVIYGDIDEATGHLQEIWLCKIDEKTNPRELAVGLTLQHYPRIAVDNNNNFHVAVQLGPGDFGMGVWYTNNIGGKWKEPETMPFSAGFTKLPGIAADGFGNVALVWACTWGAQDEEVWFTSLYPVVPKYFYPPVKALGTVPKKTQTEVTYKLTWEANPENNPDYLQGYNIYKKENEGSFELLASVDKSTFSYTYTSTDLSKKMQFGITTVSTSGGESNMEIFEFFYPPQNLSMFISLSRLKKGGGATYNLSWQANPDNNDARIQGYNIYKKEGDGNFEKIASLAKTTFSTSFTFPDASKRVKFAITTVHISGLESNMVIFGSQE